MKKLGFALIGFALISGAAYARTGALAPNMSGSLSPSTAKDMSSMTVTVDGTTVTLPSAFATQTIIGTATSATNPHRTGAVTTGLYSTTATSFSGAIAGTRYFHVDSTGIGLSTVTPDSAAASGTLANYTYPLTGPQLRAVTGATDTILSTDGNKVISANRLAGVAFTLPAATGAGFTSPFSTTIRNDSGADSTVTSTTLINNVYSLTLQDGEWVQPFSDSSRYHLAANSNIFDHNRVFETAAPMTTIDNRFTASNATAGVCSYYNSSGTLSFTSAGVCSPRYSYSITTPFPYLGIVVESERINLDVASQFTSAANWSGANVTLSYLTATGPSGTAGQATTLTTTATTASHYTQGKGSSVSYANGSMYTQSVYAKAGTEAVIQLTFPSAAFGSSVYANFDLAGLTATGTYTTAAIDDVGNSWRRLSVTATATANSTTSPGAISFTNNNTGAARLVSFDGTAGLTLGVSSHQIEEGIYPSSYIRTATVGTATTRSADLITLQTPYYLKNDEGTYCVMHNTIYNQAGVVAADSAADHTLISLTATSYGANDGSTSGDFDIAQIAAGTTQWNCLRWSAATGYMNMAVNGTLGTQVAFDGSMNLSANINLFRDYNGANRVDSHFRAVKAWTYPLSDAAMATESTP